MTAEAAAAARAAREFAQEVLALADRIHRIPGSAPLSSRARVAAFLLQDLADGLDGWNQ